jgi:DNA topoisomerase-6 subunit B
MFTFIDPDGEKKIFQRTSTAVPRETLEIKPHPHGIEIGVMMRMIKRSHKRTLLSFLTTEFTRVGATSAKHMVKQAGLKQSMDPKDLTRFDLEKLIKAMGKVDLMKPPTDCLSPIGHAALKKEIRVELAPEFVITVTREPAVYRGMPFQLECGLAYGGNIREGSARVMRFANKVPLMYEKGSCAITQGVSAVDWRRYNLNQPGGSGLPSGPLIIIVHMCSVWMPFRSEAKSAIASYPIIIKEIKLAIQECARQLGVYLVRKSREKKHAAKISTFVRYSPEVAKAIAGLTEGKEVEIKKMIDDMLEKKFGDLSGIGQGDKRKVDEGGEGAAETDSDEPEPIISDSDQSFE